MEWKQLKSHESKNVQNDFAFSSNFMLETKKKIFWLFRVYKSESINRNQ